MASIFNIKLDMSGYTIASAQLEVRIQKALQKAAAELTGQIEGFIKEKVQNNLKSSRNRYLEALHSDFSGGIGIISLDKSARWIEDGMDPHSMVRDLLKGRKSRVIAFDHSDQPQNMTQAGRDLRTTIQKALNKVNISFKGIEETVGGKAKVGTLHRLNISGSGIQVTGGPNAGTMKSLSNRFLRNNPAALRVGSVSGIPLLQGTTIAQELQWNKKQKQLNMVKTAKTFRTVTADMEAEGRWFYPGLAPRHFFEESIQFADNLWNNTIKNKILADIINPSNKI